MAAFMVYLGSLSRQLNGEHHRLIQFSRDIPIVQVMYDFLDDFVHRLLFNSTQPLGIIGKLEH